jgi:hypothetical protein
MKTLISKEAVLTPSAASLTRRVTCAFHTNTVLQDHFHPLPLAHPPRYRPHLNCHNRLAASAQDSSRIAAIRESLSARVNIG